MYKRTKSKRTVSVKAFVAILALVLALGCAAGGTFAWLTAQTSTVTNTFTYGDINITLGETTGNSYKIIPGVNIKKDPRVTVAANSEACWLFVMVEEEGTFVDNKVTYSIRNVWTQGTGANGDGVPTTVYYREVSADDAKAGVDYYVLTGDETHPNGVITVSDTLTKGDIQSITAEDQPKLKFTAYAVQKDGIDKVEDAWAKVAPSTTNP